MWVVFALLYAPILVLLLFSFNRAGSLNHFSTFSLYWYRELFRDAAALTALRNSLVLAVSSSLIATVIGTLAALGIDRTKSKFLKGSLTSVTNIPMMNPDIVTGVSMMLLFVFVGTALRVSGDKLNFWTILIAHVTFCLPYVYLSITPRLRQMDKHLPEAAQDLGCTPLQSFFKVELPFIMPGIISGMIMAFTLSLDDFVISYFTTSESEFTTLPILIYSMTKKEVKPVVYALSTLIIVTIISLLLLSNFAKKDKAKKAKQTKI
jgi:spermidine/putrescine transport system permease protein